MTPAVPVPDMDDRIELSPDRLDTGLDMFWVPESMPYTTTSHLKLCHLALYLAQLTNGCAAPTQLDFVWI